MTVPGCAGEMSALDPAGPAARHVATLWWIMLGGAVTILLGVVGTALYAFRSRRGLRSFSTRRVLIGWGLAFPITAMLALMIFALARGEQLLARDAGQPMIRAHAQQWFWMFEHPEGPVTRGVLHVRAGEDFTLAVTSQDVIHSFWVPRLGGKMDAVPGKVNRIRLRADRAGTYLGTCAEYCGIGHAHMPFEVRAYAPADYAAALAAAPAEERERMPVLRQGEAPAATIIESWGDYILDLLGVT